MTAGKGRLVADEHSRTRALKPARLPCPEVCVEEALERHPGIQNVGPQLIPPQEAVNSLAKLRYGAAATEPPNTQYSSPQLAQEPRAPHEAVFRRASEADLARRLPYDMKQRHPTQGA